MEFIIVIFILFIMGIAWVVEKIQDATGSTNRSSKHSSYQSNIYSHSASHQNNTLPNGYSRQDYYDYGYSDFDIEYWGLDQPGAPEPEVAGFVVADMMDGDFDGDIDFLF